VIRVIGFPGAILGPMEKLKMESVEACARNVLAYLGIVCKLVELC